MIVGCYTLDLYCDTPDCPASGCRYGGTDSMPPFQTTAETGPACRRKARRAGWKLNLHDGTALCPKCARAATVLRWARMAKR